MFRVLKSLLLSMVFISSVNANAGLIRVALNDFPGPDMLPTLIAIERSKERGLAIKVDYMLSEEKALLAILNNRADIGMGVPYQKVQQTDVPLRMFFQINKLRFHPVVDSRYFNSWEELDGEDMYSHGKGSGTEAMVKMMAKKHGIKYRKMVYLSGSGVRANAMVNGRVHATVVDTERKNKLIARPNSPFKVLPIEKINATDEALFANETFIRANPKELGILVEELLFVWNRMNREPAFIVDQRNNYGLLPKVADIKILQYVQEMVAEGAFSNDGGRTSAFSADIEFYGFAGTIKKPEEQKLEHFWNFSILDKALDSPSIVQ
ncbi:ABC transporter substrate-binding protein [Neptuniibacter sp. QD48_11]|uniref:ABC transporter substrate-binding protein n=1 Tax=unclassified Neptuniibacter TaxID=2630693 RepID=UPI0039F4E7EB